MPRRPKYDWEAVANDVFDVLAENPEGLTRPELEDLTGLSSNDTGKAIHKLRHLLGEGSYMNVVWHKDGNRVLYSLQETVEGTSQWRQYMRRRAISELHTQAAIWKSLHTAAGDSPEQWMTAHASKVLGRLIEDLEDLNLA